MVDVVCILVERIRHLLYCIDDRSMVLIVGTLAATTATAATSGSGGDSSFVLIIR